MRIWLSDAEQFNGREGETATFLKRSLVNSELRVGGFAPRHLSRYAAISWYSVKGMKNDKAT